MNTKPMMNTKQCFDDPCEAGNTYFIGKDNHVKKSTRQAQNSINQCIKHGSHKVKNYEDVEADDKHVCKDCDYRTTTDKIKINILKCEHHLVNKS